MIDPKTGLHWNMRKPWAESVLASGAGEDVKASARESLRRAKGDFTEEERQDIDDLFDALTWKPKRRKP